MGMKFLILLMVKAGRKGVEEEVSVGGRVEVAGSASGMAEGWVMAGGENPRLGSVKGENDREKKFS